MRHESGGTIGARRRMSAELVVGVDEAGRGPLAGPVVVGAVILDTAQPVAGVADSKRLTARRREALADTIRRQALAWVVVRAEPAEIDELNILQATMRAMQHAVAALPVPAQRALIDGNRCPPLDCPAKAVVGGDGSEPAIGAASILAKVARDQDMVALDDQWPGYGFARHKGYPTRDHVAALRRLGACPAHRRSFAPVREALTAPELPLEDT